MAQTEVKYFTPKEAQKTLPLVKQIVKDILICGNQVKEISQNMNGQNEDNPIIQNLMEMIDSYIRELEELGCFYKDWSFTFGLVDFPSVIEDEEVMLCWKSDEPKLLFYHGVDESFKNRKRIPEVYF